MKTMRWSEVAASTLAVGAAALLGMWTCSAQATTTIQWRLGPDYPMGIQDSAVGIINGKVVSAGGFTRYPLDVVQQYPDAFGGESSGFTKLTFAFDPQNESAGWSRIPDMPGPARQGGAVAVVNDAMYVMGGINYDSPHTYNNTYRLQNTGGQWSWQTLSSAQLPWPVYGQAGSTGVIGSKIYLFGAADFFQGPGAQGEDFHSEAGRTSLAYPNGSPVSKALLVLDTANLGAGWTRLADCPGVPKFDSGVAAAGGKIYQLGGIYAPLDKTGLDAYYNAVDSWSYDPASNQWTQLADMPDGANRRALTYDDRYIHLVAGATYTKTWNLDGTVTDAYTDEWGFQKKVLSYDTMTGVLTTVDPLIEQTATASGAILGDTMYILGGEGGPRLFHPATLQIGQISVPEPSTVVLLLCAGVCLLAFRRRLSGWLK